MAYHQRPRIVHQHLLRHPAEGRERALQPGEPVLLLLGPERTHMQPARMAESGHEHEGLDPPAADLDRRSPKSICNWWPGGVSNRVVASASAFRA
jgi:hypothetical protein